MPVNAYCNDFKLEILQMKLGAKDLPITCETDNCFKIAEWWVDGFAHCQECKDRIVTKFAELDKRR